MRSQKGITLTSLILYILLLMIVISILSFVSSYFYSNVKYVQDMGKYTSNFNKFNMYFVEDVKNNSEIYKVEAGQLVFQDGTIYTFENNSIYRNKTKICQEVENMTFSKKEVTDNNNFKKYIVTVNISIGDSQQFKSENDYVLKYW